MFQGLINLRLVGSGQRISVTKETITNRKNHAFFYKVEGQTRYKFKDQELVFDTDTVLYLPKGSSFYYEQSGQIDGRFLSVSFDGEFDHPMGPVLFTFATPGEVRRLFMKLQRAYRFGGQIGRLEAYSYFYKLLAVLERNLQQNVTDEQEDQRIKPAVTYLQEHLFDSSLRISQLHTMCGLSAPSFRKAFAAQFSASPKKYVLQQRMQEAKEILKNGDYDSISQIAATVGFEDHLYFSKCFKSYYGVPPSSYNAH